MRKPKSESKSPKPAQSRLGSLGRLLGRKHTSSNEGELRTLPVSRLEVSPQSLRHGQSVDEAEEITQSVQERGLQAPLLVRPSPTKRGWYEVAAGARRLHALQRLGMKTAHCLVRKMSDLEVLLASFVENDQRCPVDPITKGAALKRLLEWEENGRRVFATQTEMAHAVGRDTTYVSIHMGFLRLDPDVQDWLRHGEVCFNLAKALIPRPLDEQRLVGHVARGERTSVQMRMLEAIKQDPSLLSLSRKQLKETLLGLLSSYTGEERFRLRKLYRQCGLDPNSIQWSTMTRPSYEQELRDKERYLAKRALQHDLPVVKPPRENSHHVDRLVERLQGLTFVVMIEEEVHAVSLDRLSLGGIEVMGIKYHLARHLEQRGIQVQTRQNTNTAHLR